MGEASALRVAIELVHVPSQVRHVRSAPLPGDVPLLLRIAAGDEDALRSAAELTKRPADVVGKAAEFFIEQILLAPDADSYRILGSGPRAESSELRRNMVLLLRWLHPDVNRKRERSIFASRVTVAWGHLKTAESREAYDRTLAESSAKPVPPRGQAASSRMRQARQQAARGPHVSNRASAVRGSERMGFLSRAWEYLFHRRRAQTPPREH